MKKVSLKYIVDQLGELGWDYSCGRMSRSGMEIYDGIMRHVGVIKLMNIGMKMFLLTQMEIGNHARRTLYNSTHS